MAGIFRHLLRVSISLLEEEMDWPLLTVLIISALCSSEARGVIVPDFNLIKALAAKMKLYQVISLLKMLLQVHLYTVMILCSCSLCNIYLSKFSYLNHLNNQDKKSRHNYLSFQGGETETSGWGLNFCFGHMLHKWTSGPQGESERWGVREVPIQLLFFSLGNPSHAFCLLILETVTAWNVSFPKVLKT